MATSTGTLTARQTRILKVLIDEYIETTLPVGSTALEKKYNLGVSPATIRHEMVGLTKSGFLKQPHTSAGRVPTPKALKFYIAQLMEEKQMSLADEVKAKEDVREVKKDLDKLMREATSTLARKTQQLAVSTTEDGEVWSYGHANVFNNPQLHQLQVCQSLFSILDQERRMHELFFERLTGASPIEVLFGEELGWDFFDPVGVVATRFSAAGNQGAIGVIGPFGLNYPAIIPIVRYFGNLIEELAG
jgi:heat-inducible transcriptional repressor